MTFYIRLNEDQARRNLAQLDIVQNEIYSDERRDQLEDSIIIAAIIRLKLKKCKQKTPTKGAKNANTR